MKKLLLSLVSAFLIFTLSAQVTENFSDYTVGGKLAQQAQAMGRDYWSTWSGAVGNYEDGVIAEMGGSKCVKIVTANDQVLKFGGKTSGVWNLSFKMYVPSGTFGYFNILANFAGFSSNWAPQVYFGAGGETPNPLTPGVGTIHAAVSNAASFTFNHNEWIDIFMIVDLDENLGYFYLNDTFIISWIWTEGSFGGTQTCPKKIDALDFYGPDDSTVAPEFYIADIVFAEQLEPGEPIFKTGFDEVPNCSYVSQSYPNYWTTWNNKPGTSEDALITNEQAISKPRAAKFVYDTDLLYKAGNKTTGAYVVDFEMYIPNNAPAYFNLLHIFNGNNSEWAVGVYFNITNSQGGPQAGTYVQQSNEIYEFTAPNNTWFPVSFIVDLDNDNAKISINGTQILEWQFSTVESSDGSLEGLKQLAAVDFYPPETGAVFYIDNFMFGELGSVATFEDIEKEKNPIIDVTPTSISEKIVEGGNAITVPIKLTNTGTAEGTYKAEAKCNDELTWLTLDGEIEGVVAMCGNKSFKAVIDAGELEMGKYEAVITISTNDVLTPKIEISCTLNIELGINDFSIQTLVFPNPSSDFVDVVCNLNIETIQIINYNGQIVYNATVNNDKTNISTSNLSAGFYFIRVVTKEGAHNVKLIVK
jgi:hypothetical protein